MKILVIFFLEGSLEDMVEYQAGRIEDMEEDRWVQEYTEPSNLTNFHDDSMASIADDSAVITWSSSSAYSSYFGSASRARVSVFNIYPAASMLNFFRILTLLFYFKPVQSLPEAQIPHYYAEVFLNLSVANWKLNQYY